MMNIEHDEALGILRCVSRGTSTIAEVEAFAQKAMALQAVAQARHGRCLILADATKSAVHTQEATTHFAAMAATKHRGGDRTAILLTSTLAKLQAQRMVPRDATAYFTNEAEALAWLLADPA